MVVPPKHHKMIIFSRKTHGFVGETHHFRKSPYRELVDSSLSLEIFLCWVSPTSIEVKKWPHVFFRFLVPGEAMVFESSPMSGKTKKSIKDLFSVSYLKAQWKDEDMMNLIG